jgi:ribonuclease HI
MWDSKNKFYVVRKWRDVWIFNSREECKKNVTWFPDAKYKSFSSKTSAEIALQKWWNDYYKIKNNTKENIMMNDINIPFFSKGIAVDAACSGNPWEMEYRWVDLKTWVEIFHENFKIWTNNIWEFLAIIHWLKYLWDDDRVIYSDSRIAISRVNQWKCKTTLNTEKSLSSNFYKLFITIESAEEWLKENGIKHKILKWNTEKRWEIPADFWRK